MRRVRGQTETVGVILLTAVVVILASVVSVVFLSNIQNDIDDGPLLDVETNVTSSDIVIEHQGGDTLEEGDVTVVVSGEDKPLSSLTPRRGDADTFAPGDRWVDSHSLTSGSVVDILVIDDDTGTLVHEATHTVP